MRKHLKLIAIVLFLAMLFSQESCGNCSIIFNNSSITATHELGHNLGLQHTFENVGSRKLPERSTKNIMDYSGSPDMRRYFFLYQIKHLKTK
jgi:predicted Zn-dependent protease